MVKKKVQVEENKSPTRYIRLHKSEGNPFIS